MKLKALLHNAYLDGGDRYVQSAIDYALEYLEYYGSGNETLQDNAREDVVHNGAVKRNHVLSGEEVLERGVYTLTSFGHDGREVLVRHKNIQDAKEYEKEWNIGDNPYVNACFIEVVF